MSRSRINVLLAALCFGTTGTAQALGPSGADPMVVGAVRIAIGASLLLVILRLVGGGLPTGADIRALGVAALGVGCYQLCFFTAVRDTGVAVGTVVALGSAPAIAGGLTWLVDKDRPDAAWVAATALATAGVGLMSMAGSEAAVSALGILLALGAGASYAVFALGSKRLLDAGQRIEAVMAWCFAGGAVLLVPVLFLGDLGWLREGRGVAMALWLGLVPTALAYLLFAAGLRRLPAREVATLTLAEPMTATVLGVLVLTERPGPVAIIGIALVLAGTAVIARGRSPSRREPDADVIAGAA